ncbi:MAG: DoxX family protein [Rikenellaceae bacterium]
MSRTLRLAHLLVGALFIFSGFAKGVNPFGLSVQFGEYFSAMGLEFLMPYATICAVLLPTVEMTLGVMLTLGVFRRVTAWTVLLFMSFFTLLTLWIAVENPVQDCGCFGDLLKISNWATFYKNLCFMVPTIYLFMYRKQGVSCWGWRTVVVSAIVCGMLPLYCYNNLPLLDGTAFKVGTNVWEAMNDGVPDKTQTLLEYRNIESGEIREFKLTDKEWQDASKWEFVESVTEVLVKGKQPTISQLPMIDERGVDRAQELLSDFRGEMLLIVSPNPARQSMEIAQLVMSRGSRRVVLLHSSLQGVMIPDLEVYTTDMTTIKAMVQSYKGGVLLLRDGVIVEKKVL